MATGSQYPTIYDNDVEAIKKVVNNTALLVDGGGSSGGVTKLIAGTGVALNPTSGIGAVQINLTGTGGGTVTSVSSANANIGVASPTTTPVLTINPALAGISTINGNALASASDTIALLAASQTFINKTFDTATNTFKIAGATVASIGTGLSISGGVLSSSGGGSGTVTTVSVVTANGVSGSVANPTTTPAITLVLGAITPTTVNGNTVTTGTGTLTLGSATLNAGAGGTLGSNAFTSTAYVPTSTTVNGHALSSNVVISASDLTTGVLGAAYGGTGVANNASNTITFSGNFGLTLTLTAGTSVTLPTSGTLVNSAVTTLSSLASIGTITTGVWTGTTIAIANGGTGQTTASAAITALLPSQSGVTSGWVLSTNGTIASWSAPSGGLSGGTNTQVIYFTGGSTYGSSSGFVSDTSGNITAASYTTQGIVTIGSQSGGTAASPTAIIQSYAFNTGVNPIQIIDKSQYVSNRENQGVLITNVPNSLSQRSPIITFNQAPNANFCGIGLFPCQDNYYRLFVNGYGSSFSPGNTAQGIVFEVSGGPGSSSMLFSASRNLVFGTTYNDNGNGKIQLASSTSAAAGIAFGNDTSGGQCSIYRSAANTLSSPAASWVFSGTVTCSHHIGGGSAPTIAAGSGAGTSPTVSISGTDSAGQITITSGTLPSVSAVIATVTFSVAYGAAPYVVLWPSNAAASILNFLPYVGSTTTTFTVNAGTVGLAGATTYTYNYLISQ